MTLPEDVKASYRIHDGQSADAPWLFNGHEFLSLQRVTEECKVWKELLDGGDFEVYNSDPDGPVRDDSWNAAWVPLTYDGSGNHDCLDLSPAPGGNLGQIIEMWHDGPERTLLAPSFREWLQAFADGLQQGKYVVLSEEHGGIVDKDYL